jgi:hypothetical protein
VEIPFLGCQLTNIIINIKYKMIINILTSHIFNFMNLVKLVGGLSMPYYNNLPVSGQLQISIKISDGEALQ